MIRALPYDSGFHPDVARILAIAAAIAVHVLAFLLLLLPLATPRLSINAADPPAPRTWWVRVEPPVVPPPPQLAAVAPERPTPRTPPPAALSRPVQQPVAPTADAGTLPAEPAIDTAPVSHDIAPIGAAPALGVELEYRRATPPPYPRTALTARAEGTVLLRIWVDTDGQPLDVTIERGSGHRDLDETARRHVLRHWRFKPAMRNGTAVQAYGLVPIDFRLQ